jgi:hypothetical protein
MEQRQHLRAQSGRVPIGLHGKVEGAARICEERARQAAAAAAE